MDDYLFFAAVAALIAGAGLFFALVGTLYTVQAVSEGKTLPPPNFIHTIENEATYVQIAELLSWTAIFSVEFSFLFYFRALVKRLYKMEAWWWFTFVTFIPITAISISGAFIVCPHAGSSVLCKFRLLSAQTQRLMPIQ